MSNPIAAPDSNYNYIASSPFNSQIKALMQGDARAAPSGQANIIWTESQKRTWYVSVTVAFASLLVFNLTAVTCMIVWASGRETNMPTNMEGLLTQEIKKNLDKSRCDSGFELKGHTTPVLQLILSESQSNAIQGKEVVGGWTLKFPNVSIIYYEKTASIVVHRPGRYQIYSHLSFNSDQKEDEYTHEIQQKTGHILYEKQLKNCYGVPLGSNHHGPVCHSSLLMGVVELKANDKIQVSTNKRDQLIRDGRLSYFGMHLISSVTG